MEAVTAPHERPPEEWPTDSCGSPLLFPCDGCHRGFGLLMRTKNRQACPDCYVLAGSPKLLVEIELGPLEARLQMPRVSRKRADDEPDGDEP